jgi:hypothetical protein
MSLKKRLKMSNDKTPMQQFELNGIHPHGRSRCAGARPLKSLLQSIFSQVRYPKCSICQHEADHTRYSIFCVGHYTFRVIRLGIYYRAGAEHMP